MKLARILILTVALAAIVAPAFAQNQMPGPPRGEEIDPDDGPGRGGPPSNERREEIRKKIEAIKVWRLTEELDLDEKTAVKFFPALSSLTQRRTDLVRENIELERELRLYVDSSKIDEKRIKATLDKIEKNHHELAKLNEKEIETIKEYLTVEQQARYHLFQQDFQREMRGRMAGARGGKGAGMRGGPGRGGTGPGVGSDIGRPSE